MVDVTTNCHRKTARTRVIALSPESFSATENCHRTSARTHVIVCYIRSPFPRHKNATARPMLLLTSESFSATLSTSVLRMQYHDGNFHHFILTSPFKSLLGYCFHCDGHFLLACFSMFDLNRFSPKMGPSLAQFTRKDIMGSVFETTKRLASLRWPTDNC
jgi:hypothetical protein